MNTYTTVSGDTWDLISLNLYGSCKYAVKLMEANPEHQSTVFFSAGVKLKKPDISEVVLSTNLPPWKQGGL